MENYICVDCMKQFDEPDTYQECVGEFWGTPAYDTFYKCPYCGSDAVMDTLEYFEENPEELDEE